MQRLLKCLVCLLWAVLGTLAAAGAAEKPNILIILADMQADRTEMHNLAAQHPDKVKELATKWDAWAARANVLPLGGWKAKAAAE